MILPLKLVLSGTDYGTHAAVIASLDGIICNIKLKESFWSKIVEDSRVQCHTLT